MSADLAVHPVADLFPMLPEDELADLAADIKERGLLQPIVLDGEGRILDGRNRHAACLLAGIEPSFKTYEGDDPDGYAAATNLGRRDMSKGQKAVVIARYREYKNYTRDDAESFGVSKQYISWARSVLSFAPDLVDSVLSGIFPLSDAYQTASERKAAAANRKTKMDRLRQSADDLRVLVEEERMSVDDAIAALEAREEKACREAEEAERLRRLAFSGVAAGSRSKPPGANSAASWSTSHWGVGHSPVRLELATR